MTTTGEDSGWQRQLRLLMLRHSALLALRRSSLRGTKPNTKDAFVLTEAGGKRHCVCK